MLLFFQLYFDAVKINKINLQVTCYCTNNILKVYIFLTVEITGVAGFLETFDDK